MLRFDFTGLGNSEGDFSNTNFSSNVEDLVAAAAAISSSHQPPALLIGHSLGGTAALAAAARIASIKAVATIGSPADPEHVIKLFGDQAENILASGEQEVRLAGRTFNIKKQFLEDVKAIDTGDYLASLGKATMIFHSPQDELVNIDQARLVYQRLRHPKNFISLDGADHMLSSERDSDFVAATLAAWANRYIDSGQVVKTAAQMGGTQTHGNNLNIASTSPDDASSSTASASTAPIPVDISADRPAKGTVRVKEVSGFRQLVSTADHDLIADEPVGVGGENLGMTPYDLLLAALGTCTSMTLRMYAKHKNLALDAIEVELSHQQIHAQDCADCETETGKITEIVKEIRVTGSLTADQVIRLNEIADRCPVHRTLMQEKRIRSTTLLVDSIE